MRKIGKAVGSRDREQRAVVQAWVEESAATVHFEVRHKAIPVRNRAPAGPCMQIDATQTERRRDERCAGRVGPGDGVVGHPLRIERLAVENRSEERRGGKEWRW